MVVTGGTSYMQRTQGERSEAEGEVITSRNRETENNECSTITYSLKASGQAVQ